MSVPRSKRRVSKAEYVKSAMNLVLFTINETKKMPKSYQHAITNPMLDSVNEIYENCLKANSYYLGKAIPYNSFKARQDHLRKAKAALAVFSAQLNILRELLKKGNTVYKNNDAMDRAFDNWGRNGKTCAKLIKSIMDSDKKRWNEVKEERKKARQEKQPIELVPQDSFDVIENIADGMIKDKYTKEYPEDEIGGNSEGIDRQVLINKILRATGNEFLIEHGTDEEKEEYVRRKKNFEKRNSLGGKVLKTYEENLAEHEKERKMEAQSDEPLDNAFDDAPF